MTFFTISLLSVFITAVIGVVWKDLGNTGKTILILFLIISTSYSWYEHKQNVKKDRYSRDFGEFNFPVESKKITMCLGGMCGASNDRVRNKIGSDKMEAWAEDGKLNLQLTIRDVMGDIVFYVNGTDWKNLSGTEFNHDKNGLEVKDAKGNIIFQLEFNSADNKINVFGFLFYSQDNVVWAERGKTIMNPSFDNVLNLDPMFRYPRESYLGVRVSG